MDVDQNWPKGWEKATPLARDNIEAQLRRELGAGHELTTLSPRYIGRSAGSDDYVFAVDQWKAPYFVVHLTWSASSLWVPDCVPLEKISDLESAIL